MYVKVRPMNGAAEALLALSKLTKVEDFRLLVEEKFSVSPDRQRLFFKGKQLEDGYPMYDYNVNVNDVIQLMVRGPVDDSDTKEAAASSEEDKENKPQAPKATQEEQCSESEYYREGDLVDTCHDGSWWEAEIVKITRATSKDKEHQDGFLYHVSFDKDNYEEPNQVPLSLIRPRASKGININDLETGQLILVNYNIDEPKERGYWYHAKVEQVVDGAVVVSLQTYSEETLSGCVLHFTAEILTVPDHVLLANRDDGNSRRSSRQHPPASRAVAPTCNSCGDNVRRKCKECGCCKCGGKQDPDKQLMCDECDRPYHIYCLSPPLPAIPDVEEWFCPLCKNDATEIVGAGEKLKDSKKRANMVCKKSTSSRDWGKGYACAGRSKLCTIVPADHYGPIPGVEVGSSWLYRIQASESGVHRPPVSGIHGGQDKGAYSIVLAGGYEDDEDNGDTFTYTGAGGRDLSNNKRTAEQSSDQKLTSTNRALALNCNCKLNEAGGDAGSKWKEGKQLRVIRSYKGRKHSEYAPEEGIRYDGIYKVCKYWQAPGKSGFMVWRYEMRRDDTIPAPWTKDGKMRIKELGLVMEYPPDKQPTNETSSPATSSSKGRRGKKRKASQDDSDDDDEESSSTKGRKGKKRKASQDDSDNNNEEDSPIAAKRPRVSVCYTIDSAVSTTITSDKSNAKLWAECKRAAVSGHQSFVESVKTEFSCVCCYELVLQPVTTPCSHNVCLDCIKRSFQAEVYSCPACRHDLESSYKMPINSELMKALKTIFPGYRGTAPLK